jgi:hypothetical protein
MDAIHDFVDSAERTGLRGEVEVDQRALVDKMLARYCTDGVVLRELLQNADDSGATQVEFHFKSPAGAGRSPGEPPLLTCCSFGPLTRNLIALHGHVEGGHVALYRRGCLAWLQ